MFICDTPARAFKQVMRAHNDYNGCPRCIEEGEFIDNRMTFPGADYASQTSGNKSTVTDDLPIMSKELFIAFDEDYLKVNFLK
jgi:hypothetical protein